MPDAAAVMLQAEAPLPEPAAVVVLTVVDHWLRKAAQLPSKRPTGDRCGQGGGVGGDAHRVSREELLERCRVQEVPWAVDVEGNVEGVAVLVDALSAARHEERHVLLAETR